MPLEEPARLVGDSHLKNPSEYHAHLQSQQMSLRDDTNSAKGVVHLQTQCTCMLRRACVVLSVRSGGHIACHTRHRTVLW